MEMRDCPVRLQPGIEGGQDVTLDTALLSHAGIAALILTTVSPAGLEVLPLWA